MFLVSPELSCFSPALVVTGEMDLAIAKRYFDDVVAKVKKGNSKSEASCQRAPGIIAELMFKIFWFSNGSKNCGN